MTTALGAESMSRVEVLFKALANPIRLSILQLLAETPLCVHELVEQIDASQPLVSQHLRVLRTAGVVEATRRGKEIVYALHDRHVPLIVDEAIRHTLEREP